MDADLAAAFAGSCPGCGFSMAGVVAGCTDCARRNPEQMARFCGDLSEEVQALREFKAKWRRAPTGDPGVLRGGTHNRHTLYWQPLGAGPRDDEEEPVGFTLTPAWTEYICRASQVMEALARETDR